MSTPQIDFQRERADMLAKAARGELTFEDTKRYIEMRRGTWLANAGADAAAAPKTKAAKKLPETMKVDFF